MRKRLRKKLRVGEFQRVYCRLKCGFKVANDDAFAVALDAVTDLCETRGLCAGGGASPTRGLELLIYADRGDVTETDRLVLLECVSAFDTTDAAATLVDEATLLAEE